VKLAVENRRGPKDPGKLRANIPYRNGAAIYDVIDITSLTMKMESATCLLTLHIFEPDTPTTCSTR